MDDRARNGLFREGSKSLCFAVFLISFALANAESDDVSGKVQLYDEYVQPVSTSAYVTKFVHNSKEYTLGTTKTTWAEAKYICQSMHGSLAILDEYSKALFLAEALAETDYYLDSVWIGASRHPGGRDYHWITNQKPVPRTSDLRPDASFTFPHNLDSVWIGASRQPGGRDYHWITNQKPVPRTKTNVWNARQLIRPSNNSPPVWINRTDIPVPEQGADCVALQRGYHDEPIFVDLYCNVKRGFACEIEVNPSHSGQNALQQINTVQCDTHTYKIFSMKATWEQAVGICNDHGMSLASFDTVKCTEKIGSKMMRLRPSIENAWIGGKGEEGQWIWLSSGELISASGRPGDPDAARWPPFRDHVAQKYRGCLLIDRHVCNETIFLEARCDRTRSFICQYPEVSPDVDDIITENLHEDLTHFFVLVPQPLPYDQATDYCRRINGSLASVTDKEIFIHLLLAMGESIQDPVNHIWVSGVLHDKDGNRNWIDPNTGLILPGPEYNDLPWCEDEEPEISDACLNMDRDSPLEGVIYGMPCDQPQAFICIIEKKNLPRRLSKLPKLPRLPKSPQPPQPSQPSKPPQPPKPPQSLTSTQALPSTEKPTTTTTTHRPKPDLDIPASGIYNSAVAHKPESSDDFRPNFIPPKRKSNQREKPRLMKTVKHVG